MNMTDSINQWLKRLEYSKQALPGTLYIQRCKRFGERYVQLRGIDIETNEQFNLEIHDREWDAFIFKLVNQVPDNPRVSRNWPFSL